MLSSISNNAEIGVIWEQYQKELEPIREILNNSLKEMWEEWQVPRNAEDSWSDKIKKLHGEWWKLRIERQQKIDASIAAKADFEYCTTDHTKTSPKSVSPVHSQSNPSHPTARSVLTKMMNSSIRWNSRTAETKPTSQRWCWIIYKKLAFNSPVKKIKLTSLVLLYGRVDISALKGVTQKVRKGQKLKNAPAYL